jgi:hypothetical protein
MLSKIKLVSLVVRETIHYYSFNGYCILIVSSLHYLLATEDEIEADTQGYHCSDRRFALGLTLTNIFSKL